MLWSNDDDFGTRMTTGVAMVGRVLRSPRAAESKGRQNEYLKTLWPWSWTFTV